MSQPLRPPQEREVRKAADRYTAAVLEGDGFEAGLVVVEALNHGWPTALVYSSILADSLHRIGDAWHQGNISVAHEHRATELTLGEMERVRRSAPRGRPNGMMAVVAAVEGERHTLAARMAADLLYLNGWEVDFLGADTPSPDIARICEERSADVVLLSATVADSLLGLRSAIDILGVIRPKPKILLGGEAAVAAEQTGGVEGHDAVARTVDDVPRLARALALGSDPVELDVLLTAMGRQIQDARVSRGWSQQQLADAAGLDRTFISALEHGKQNISVGALKKLSDALGIGIPDLIGSSDSAGS